MTKLEQTKQALAGKHKAIDDWLDARQALLVDYMRLAGLTPARTKQRSLPKTEQLQQFATDWSTMSARVISKSTTMLSLRSSKPMAKPLNWQNVFTPISVPAPNSPSSLMTSTVMPMRPNCCCLTMISTSWAQYWKIALNRKIGW